MINITRVFTRLSYGFLRISSSLLLLTYHLFGDVVSVESITDNVILINISEPDYNTGMSSNSIANFQPAEGVKILINNSPTNTVLNNYLGDGQDLIIPGNKNLPDNIRAPWISLTTESPNPFNFSAEILVLGGTEGLTIDPNNDFIINGLKVQGVTESVFLRTYDMATEDHTGILSVSGKGIDIDANLLLMASGFNFDGPINSVKKLALAGSSICNFTENANIKATEFIDATCPTSFKNQGSIDAGKLFKLFAGDFTNEAVWEFKLWDQAMLDKAKREGHSNCQYKTDQHASICWPDQESRKQEVKKENTGKIRAQIANFEIHNKINNINGARVDVLGDPNAESTIYVKNGILNVAKTAITEEGATKEGVRFDSSVLNLNGNCTIQSPEGGFLNQGSRLEGSANGTFSFKNSVEFEPLEKTYINNGFCKFHNQWIRGFPFNHANIEGSWIELACVFGDNHPRPTKEPGMFITKVSDNGPHYAKADHLSEKTLDGNIIWFTGADYTEIGTINLRQGNETIKVLGSYTNRPIFRDPKIHTHIISGIPEKLLNPAASSHSLLAPGQNGMSLEIVNWANNFYTGGFTSIDGNLQIQARDQANFLASKIFTKGLQVFTGNGININGVMIGKEYSSNCGKGCSQKISTIEALPSILVSTKEKMQLDSGAGKTNLVGSFLLAGPGIEFIGAGFDATPLSMTLYNTIDRKKSKYLSTAKSKDVWTVSKTIQPMVLSQGDIIFNPKDPRLVAAIIKSAQGQILLQEGGNLLIEDYHVPFFHKRTVKKSGFRLPGLPGAGLEALRGEDFKTAVQDNIGILGSLRAISQMKGLADLAPVMALGFQVYQLAEEFSNRFETNGGKLGAAGIDTVMGHVGFVKLENGMFIPSGIGWYRNVVSEKTEGVELYQTTLEGKSIIMSFDTGVFTGAKFTADEIKLMVTSNLKLLASEIHQSYERKENRQQYGIHYGEGNIVSVVTGVSKADSRITQRIHSPFEMHAQSIEVTVAGNVTLQGIVHGGVVAWSVDGETIIESLTDDKDTKEDSKSGEVTVTVGPDIKTLGLAGGKGRGRGSNQWVNNHSGIAGDEVKINTGKLTMKGGYIDGKTGYVNATEINFEDVNSHDRYDSFNFFLSTNPFVMLSKLSNAFLNPAAMPARNTTGGTALLGSVDFGWQRDRKSAVSRSTIGSGLQIITNSDISGLNRDMSRVFEITKDQSMRLSAFIPVFDQGKLKENLARIGKTFGSIKAKMFRQFEGWKTVAATTQGDPEKMRELSDSLADLESECEKVLDRLAVADISEDKKVELAAKFQMAVSEIIDGPQMEVVQLDEAAVAHLMPIEPGQQPAVICLSTKASTQTSIDEVAEAIGEISAVTAKAKKVRKIQLMFNENGYLVPVEVIEDQHRMNKENAEKIAQFIEKHEESIDNFQTGLDAAGLVPLAGSIPDALNAAISAIRGKIGDTALCVLGIIPGLGEAVGATKLGVKATKALAKAEKIISQLKPHVQKQIKGMPIPKKWKTPNGGLLANELKTGNHVIEKHVGHDIFERLAKEKTIPKASTFANLESADKFIAMTIKKNQKEIKKWLKNPTGRNLPISGSFDEIVGQTLYRGSDIPQNAKDVVVVLRSDKTSKTGYSIYTAFPEIPKIL